MPGRAYSTREEGSAREEGRDRQDGSSRQEDCPPTRTEADLDTFYLSAWEQPSARESDATDFAAAVVHRHPLADVQVHSNEELERAVGAHISSRSQLQWWPLSSVELLTLDSGLQLIYKAQRLLVTEPAFYRAAQGRTSLLPEARILTDLVALRWFLFLRWAIEGKTRLLPAIPTMFDEWAAMGVARMRAAVSMRTHAIAGQSGGAGR
jgi:hypothetical protein